MFLRVRGLSALLKRLAMTVLRMRVLLGCVCLAGATVQAAEDPRVEGVDFPIGRYVAQVGADAWQFSNGRPEALLMMSTNTQWHYRPVSPWGTFSGTLMVSPKATMTLKVRSNQEMGSHVDELSVDWMLSPRLGLKAGVVDYKTSWCRTYDMGSPWVRENDPFCTVVSTSGPTGGAPGVQGYLNSSFGAYRMQGLIGTYSPLVFNYNTREFSNIQPTSYRVTKNSKQGVSVSVLNLDTATEFRLGLLGAQQSADVYGAWQGGAYQINQTYGIVFAGASFYLTPKLNMRMQALRHRMENKSVSPVNSPWPHTFQGANQARYSKVMELNYQANTNNLVALAISRYDMDQMSQVTNYPFPGYTGYDYAYQQGGISVAWRRDWGVGVFSVIQLTRSHFLLRDVYYQQDRAASANGLGMRLGYQF